jgi:hypothetical protein
MTFIAQVAEVLNPEGFKKMQAASSKFRTFDDVARAFVQITDKVKGKETKLKLVGRTKDGAIRAALPKFVAVNKQGERFTCDNFLGDRLFFSPYEEGKRAEYLSAKPTPMSKPAKSTDLDVDTAQDSEEIDFESLL